MLHYKHMHKPTGFTIVELLIVIVVIAILAAITIVAYNGIQVRTRDTIRKNDVAAIVKAIELYKADNGEPFPVGNTGWCTQLSNPAYQATISALKPYMNNKIPQDPSFAGTYQDYIYRRNGNSFTVAAELEESDLADDGIPSCATIGNTPNEYDYVITR